MSFSEWKEVKVSDIVDIIGGGTPKTKIDEYWNGDIPWLSVKDFNTDQRYVYETEKSITLKGLQNSSTKLLNKDDIIISARGTVGALAQLGRPMTFNQSCYGIRARDSSLNDYVYYLLKNMVENIQRNTHGSVFDTITRETFDILKAFIPSLYEQKAIAHILSTLDEKIEVTNRINKTLEQMAQTIFEHWFVDFEFPNEDGEPYKSSGGEMVESELGLIPKGWEVDSLSEICETVSGYSYKGKELMESKDAMITIKNFAIDGSFKINGFKEIEINERVKEKHYADLFDIIVAHTDLTQNADIIGNPTMIFNKVGYNRIIFSMDTVKVIPLFDSARFFVYELLKNDNFKAFALARTSGTTVLHLSKKALNEYAFTKQSDNLINVYNNLVKPFYLRISKLYSEILLLESIRDTLLPKLMSGEIRVPLDNEEQ